MEDEFAQQCKRHFDAVRISSAPDGRTPTSGFSPSSPAETRSFRCPEGAPANENRLLTPQSLLAAIEWCEAGFRLVLRARRGVWPGRPEAPPTVAPHRGSTHSRL